MSRTSSDRAVRKALLQAHAEIERIDLAHRVADLRESLTPRGLLQQFLPSMGNGDAEDTGRSTIGRLFTQASQLYGKYPMLWSAAVSVVAGRGRWRRVAKLIGLALATRKALQVSRRSR